ncbi:MAG: DUF6515 family protein [Mucilaginibacter sp.]
MSIAFSAILTLAFVLPASAQRGVRGAGGGGAMGGGGSIGVTRGGGFGGGGSIGVARPSFGGDRSNIGPQRSAIAPRQGVTSSGAISAGRPAYRSYPGLPTGTNRVTGRPYNGYYNYHGYYNAYYLPRLGYSLSVLPYGYYPFYWGGDPYFYSAGLFYQFNNNQYTVVEPPVGAAIKDLPDNAQSIVINGVQYYELNGVYYEPVTKDDGSVVYQVAGKDGILNTDESVAVQGNVQGGDQVAAPTVTLPKVGDKVMSIPSDSRTVKINGQKYLVTADGYYYQEVFDNDNNKSYKVVGTPDDEPNR